MRGKKKKHWIKVENQYLLFFYLLTLVCIGFGRIIYGYTSEQSNTRDVLPKASIETVHAQAADPHEVKRQKEITVVRSFLQKYHSPLADSAQDFVDSSYIYGLDYRLLPAIAGTESTFGQHTPSCASSNPFGWSSSTSPCGFYRFQSYHEAIWTVAKALGTNATYKDFQASGDVGILARNYNNGETHWIYSVQYFMEELR